jgi:hypothetical protein
LPRTGFYRAGPPFPNYYNAVGTDCVPGHEGTYRAAKEDFEKLVQCISELMPDRVDETIPSELPVKDLVSGDCFLFPRWSMTLFDHVASQQE